MTNSWVEKYQQPATNQYTDTRIVSNSKTTHASTIEPRTNDTAVRLIAMDATMSYVSSMSANISNKMNEPLIRRLIQ